MADRLTAGGSLRARSSPAVRWRARYRAVPWWARITVVYVLARIVTTVMMHGFAAVQSANSFTSDHPSYLSFAAIWDGAWYRVIATGGYPSALPVDAAGHVTENAWAFMPAYPFLVRGLMLLTGASFEAVAVTVSLLAGLGAALVFRRLFGRFLDAPQAMLRFREAVTETAGFYNTAGFVDDTRAFTSIPARHDVARRVDATYLAQQVAGGVLGLDEAAGLAKAGVCP